MEVFSSNHHSKCLPFKRLWARGKWIPSLQSLSPLWHILIMQTDSTRGTVLRWKGCWFPLVFGGQGGSANVHLAAFLKSKCTVSQIYPSYIIVIWSSSKDICWGVAPFQVHLLFYTVSLLETTLLTKATTGQSPHKELCKTSTL